MELRTDKIIGIRVQESKQHDFLTYKKAITFLGFTIRKEGAYSLIGRLVELGENNFIRNDKVMCRPCVIIGMIDGGETYRSFDRLHECNAFAERIKALDTVYFNPYTL